MDLLTYLKPFVAVYLLGGAIRGKGRLFENEYLKVSRAQYLKVMRPLCLISGILVLADGALNIFELISSPAIYWVFWGASLLSIIALLIASIMMTDRAAMKEATKQAQTQQAAAKRTVLPTSAFDFDDDASQNDK